MKSCLKISVFLVAAMILSSPDLSSASKKNTNKDITEKSVGNIRLVYIPAGSFRMGRDEKGEDYAPARKVKISKGFWIGKYEITQGQYASLIGSNPCRKSRYGEGDELPVFNISWYDAIEFCNKLSIKHGLEPYYIIEKDDRESDNISVHDDLKWVVKRDRKANGFRLPTEAEWEYACMGKRKTRFYWGNSQSWDISGRYAWHMFNAGRKKYSKGRFWWVKYHKVKKPGQKSSNSFGLYDISGNVGEWCFDRYSVSYSSAGNVDPVTDAGDFRYRVSRGGSILDSPADLEGYRRWPFEPFEKIGTNGIRVVLPE